MRDEFRMNIKEKKKKKKERKKKGGDFIKYLKREIFWQCVMMTGRM